MSHTNPPKGWATVVFGDNDEVNTPNESLVQHHSLLNLLNIIGLTVQYWELDNPATPYSRQITEQDIPSIRNWIRENPDLDYASILDLCIALNLSYNKFLQSSKIDQITEGPLSQIRDLQLLLETQINDLEILSNHPAPWVKVPFSDLENRLRHFLKAIDKNAKGRYKITFNGEPPTASNQRAITYNFCVSISSDRLYSENPEIIIPTNFKSTLQDLLANARKYSPAGTTIQASIQEKNNFFIFTVLDQGNGIPENELSKVTQFGYRASNVAEVETYGGGYGLTKAHRLSSSYHGEMTLSSMIDKGTWVQIKLPIPEAYRTH